MMVIIYIYTSWLQEEIWGFLCWVCIQRMKDGEGRSLVSASPPPEPAMHKELLYINPAAAIISDSAKRAPRWLCSLETPGRWQGLYLCFLVICPYISLFISRALAQKGLCFLWPPQEFLSVWFPKNTRGKWRGKLLHQEDLVICQHSLRDYFSRWIL